MRNTTTINLSPFRPALALVVTCCLLIAGQVAHSQTLKPEIPRVSAQELRDSVSLRGQWRFRPGDNLEWASPAVNDASWDVMNVPQRWPSGGYPEFGQLAWYRLTLQLDQAALTAQQSSRLAVRMGNVLSAYEIYAGGELLGAVGSLPPLSEVTYDRQRVFQIPASAISGDGRLTLALRVWGGDNASVNAWSAGPASGEFALGEYSQLLFTGMVGEVPGLLICTLIFGFGLYHLYLYRRNRSLDTYLWFGLMAINIAIYGLMLTQWKYLTDMSFLTMKKIEFGMIYLFPALGIQMVWSLLQLPVNRLLRLYQLSFVVASVIVVTTPGHTIHYYTLNPWQLWTIPSMIAGLWVVAREAHRGNAEARTLLAGVLVFMATCINDLLIDLAHFETVRLMAFGFIAILVSMAVSMANRFTTLLGRLESEVVERTAELSEVNEQLAEAARMDHLTGLLNRRGFAEEAASEIRRVFRSGKHFSIVLADIDNFKQFNDRYGHACGDHVLKRVGAILGERTRDVDRIARWGGEEFIILLPETDTAGAAVLAEKLREVVAENRYEFDDERLSITMTFGVAEHRKGEALDTCIARADTALYHGKERGRNKVMIGNYKGLTLVN